MDRFSGQPKVDSAFPFPVEAIEAVIPKKISSIAIPFEVSRLDPTIFAEVRQSEDARDVLGMEPAQNPDGFESIDTSNTYLYQQVSNSHISSEPQMVPKSKFENFDDLIFGDLNEVEPIGTGAILSENRAFVVSEPASSKRQSVIEENNQDDTEAFRLHDDIFPGHNKGVAHDSVVIFY